MSTTILSFSAWIVIETLITEKRSLQYIADFLGFSKTTIFNEVHRLNGPYNAKQAERHHQRRMKNRGTKTILTTNMKQFIEKKAKVNKWPLEEIAHVIGIAYKTIYNWIDQGLLEVKVTDLPDRGIRRRRARERRGTFSHGRSQLKSDRQKLRRGKLLAILKQIRSYLVNVKDKPSVALSNVKVVYISSSDFTDKIKQFLT
ncbi:transposase [Limosilactobacillus vaginalis DSM 5837 = ATCC 49540]|nr:transposase [Limosilactobacillus vaginalis DSM 5837 = ATCC 49540]